MRPLDLLGATRFLQSHRARIYWPALEIDRSALGTLPHELPSIRLQLGIVSNLRHA
jgi:hypothetical protein